MEGNNDKAVIMFLAYFIGFVTAYLAFGVDNTNDTFIYNETIEAVDPVPEVSDTTLRVRELGLFLLVGGDERLLSANKAALAEALPENHRANGFHYQLVDAQMSPNEMFVYFCEQLSAVPTECEPVVYDVATEVAYKIKVNGSYSIAIENHSAAWTPDNLLTVNSFTSSSAEEPWK